METYETWPASRGYRMPAEWEPHQATWISWPHNGETWPGMLPAVEAAMVEAVSVLAETECVRINVLDEDHRRHVDALLSRRASADSIRYHLLPTNDAWCRDYGALFVTCEGDLASPMAVAFEYNAWGGKYPPYDLDREIARSMATAIAAPSFVPGMVLEGGAIDVNGAGVLLTTEACLLNPNRNHTLDRSQIEDRLMAALGVRQVVWLGDGIEGDDTDGHVDDIARFVSTDRVVTAIEESPDDPNYLPLRSNRERLEHVRLEDGGRLDVIELPMPDPIHRDGGRLPASYANFYIANGSVLLPVFACAQDALAQEVLSACFPDRRVVPIDARDMIIGLGAIHCLTQQVPV